MSPRAGLIIIGLSVMLLTLAAAPARGQFVWVEGEQAQQSNMLRHPWYDQVKKDQLSGREWLSHFDNDKATAPEASYQFNVPEAGQYDFWLRANPVQASLRYQLNGGEWTAVPFDAPLDQINIAADEKPDLRFIAWIHLGTVPLNAGTNAVAFRMESDNAHHGGIDCFAFVPLDMNFTPQGMLRPGEAPRPTSTPPGTWAFEPQPDRFSDAALLDLRSLNEDEAGQYGFIKLSDDGNSFVRGDGAPIRFWCVNSYVFREGRDALADHAKFLAKRGVNMVRWHGTLQTKDNPDITQIDKAALDELFQLVAAMKGEGIYLTVSPYYAAATKPVNGWPVPRRGGDDMHGLLFFDDELQAAYKSWLRELLTTPNPYTGTALKDEPAIAILQIQNEDSLLFWTVANIKGKDAMTLGGKFADWLKHKYGSLEKASEAWHGEAVEGDNFTGNIVAMMHIWTFTGGAGDMSEGARRRQADQLQFLTELMRDFNAEIVRYLREDLGARQLVNAGNWQTADNVRLGDAERYSYTSADVVGVNRYYTGGVHHGEHAGWAIVNGDKFSNVSALLDPRRMPLNLKQVAGHPTIIPETLWVPPLAYQSEGPFLASVFQSLTGVDGVYWFATGEPQWRQPASANGYLPSIGKWTVATPEIMGNFPAAALMYRMGYIQPGEPVVSEKRSLDDLWQRRLPIIAEDPAYDPNRHPKQIFEHSNIEGGANPLAFLVGPVQVTYGADARTSQVLSDLADRIDQEKKIVRSVTDQITWDYGRGVCTLNAPKAQGVSGFVNKVGTFDLADVTIESRNDYATIAVVSMDDAPLATSGKVLIQMGTMARPNGWEQRPAEWSDKEGKEQFKGFEVVNYGQAPWVIVDNDATVRIGNTKLTKATILDMNGLPRESVDLERDGDMATFTMPRDAKYVVLQ